MLKAPTSLPGGKTPKFKEGDKVFGAGQGAYATHIVSTEEKLKGMPEGWSFEDAAGVFVTAPTSYAGLVVRAGIKKGIPYHQTPNYAIYLTQLQVTGCSFMPQPVVSV